VRIAAVSYLNTLPFVHGLKHSALAGQMALALDTPAGCAARLAGGAADLALVPVAALPGGRFHVVSEYCIGADGRVDSVLLLSESPLPAVRTILLDYQSLTSVALARLLEERLWKTGAVFKLAGPGFENAIQGGTAGVVIGDRALFMRPRFAYALDLAAEWKKLTGMPFVFACWAAVKPPDAGFLAAFNDALATGVAQAGSLHDAALLDRMSESAQRDYLQKSVRYVFDDAKKKALAEFLKAAAPYFASNFDLKKRSTSI
jgi:chorismate dehydratase